MMASDLRSLLRETFEVQSWEIFGISADYQLYTAVANRLPAADPEHAPAIVASRLRRL
jgi:hypothetical protein